MFIIHQALIVVKIGYIYRLFDDKLTFKTKLRTFAPCYSTTLGLNYHSSLKKNIILCFVFFSTFLLMCVIYDFVITDHMNTVRV